MSLADKISQRQGGILLYGITPPKAGHSEDKITEIAALQMQRLNSIADARLDGLVLYDIQDEAERTEQVRPFPFMATLDPLRYATQDLAPLALPKIVYRAVGKYTPPAFEADLQRLGAGPAVFVGAASRQQAVQLSLKDAYALRRSRQPALQLGGVAIPERHLASQDEHLRMAAKVAQGCSFFISQCVYHVEATKNLLSDYFYACEAAEQPMVPLVLTLTPCGSVKTLDFMKWLGISIPRWLENDLARSGDILQQSLKACTAIFAELLDYAQAKGIPLGCNVESVAIRREEIEASLQLVREVRRLLDSSRIA
ncbi:methylenetetrahydrofolate reductase [Paucibacter sp. APW11]|uniref:Methylenetetrahydrofolate reductase n=1 Tax=Roseateles aquae TaxID=3077235 RepID=A0ABU3P955_9BURK|nr:methylenetetrahydrofolate reductase [Paucibacter sp. APW11]MDT8999099.1 methylenetetrahydrofolate reductase [Paucibacter sp. APW11]